MDSGDSNSLRQLTAEVQLLRETLVSKIKQDTQAQVDGYGAAFSNQLVIDALILSHPNPAVFRDQLDSMRNELSKIAQRYADPGAVMFRAEEELEHYLDVVKKALE